MSIDISALVNTKVSAPLDTKFSIPPEGEYIVMCSDKGPIESWFNTVKMKDGSDRAQLNIVMIIQDPEVAKALGRQQATTRLTIWLDTEIDEATGNTRVSTGKGKNVSLGQLRDALGQNDDREWDFERLIAAGPLKVMTSNSTNNGRDYSNVVRVSKV